MQLWHCRITYKPKRSLLRPFEDWNFCKMPIASNDFHAKIVDAWRESLDNNKIVATAPGMVNHLISNTLQYSPWYWPILTRSTVISVVLFLSRLEVECIATRGESLLTSKCFVSPSACQIRFKSNQIVLLYYICTGGFRVYTLLVVHYYNTLMYVYSADFLKTYQS